MKRRLNLDSLGLLRFPRNPSSLSCQPSGNLTLNSLVSKDLWDSKVSCCWNCHRWCELRWSCSRQNHPANSWDSIPWSVALIVNSFGRLQIMGLQRHVQETFGWDYVKVFLHFIRFAQSIHCFRHTLSTFWEQHETWWNYVTYVQLANNNMRNRKEGNEETALVLSFYGKTSQIVLILFHTHMCYCCWSSFKKIIPNSKTFRSYLGIASREELWKRLYKLVSHPFKKQPWLKFKNIWITKRYFFHVCFNELWSKYQKGTILIAWTLES